MAKIYIALATYNGEKYLPQMLESLLCQKRPADCIIAIDDGSKDGSAKILNEFAQKLPLKITVFEKNQGHQTAFSTALKQIADLASDEDFVALADQDDVWLPEKLQVLEQALEGSAQDLVFGDAEIIDALGNKTADSWRALGGIESKLSLRTYLTGYTNVTGCLTMFRASLLSQVLPFPEGIPVHDQWITLVAAANHGILSITQKVIQYRLHGNNEIGLGHKNTWSGNLKTNNRWTKNILEHPLFNRLSKQDQEFARHFESYTAKRLQKGFLPGEFFWILKNRKDLHPHLRHLWQAIPLALFGTIGVPVATKFFGKK